MMATYNNIPQEAPPNFRLAPDTVAAIRALKRMLEEVDQPVPAWMLDVADGRRPADASPPDDDPQEPGGEDAPVPPWEQRRRARTHVQQVAEQAAAGMAEIANVFRSSSEAAQAATHLSDGPADPQREPYRYGLELIHSQLSDEHFYKLVSDYLLDPRRPETESAIVEYAGRFEGLDRQCMLDVFRMGAINSPDGRQVCNDLRGMLRVDATVQLYIDPEHVDLRGLGLQARAERGEH